MRLNLDTALLQTPDAGSTAPVARHASSGRTGPGATGGDSISISGISSALHQLSGERTARIQALSKAISEGSYQVSGSAIGNAIIRHAGG